LCKFADKQEGVTLDEEAIDAAWESLRLTRLEWEDTDGSSMGDRFFVQIRGGAWTAEHKGKAYDHVMAAARSGLPTVWAEQYKFGKMVSLSIAKYGELRARMMALEWRRRCQFYFNMCVAQPNKKYRYTGEDLDSYQEDLEWVTLLCELDVACPSWERASAIRARALQND
jgi:hypothetical protein